MQNITDLKDKVINLKDIIIKNLQDENKCLKAKRNVLENKIIDLEIQNNVDQYFSGIPQSVSDNQLEEKVADILKVESKPAIVLGRKRKILLFGLSTESIV